MLTLGPNGSTQERAPPAGQPTRELVGRVAVFVLGNPVVFFNTAGTPEQVSKELYMVSAWLGLRPSWFGFGFASPSWGRHRCVVEITQPCMSGSSLLQGARQVPDGFWSQRAVHTGWGSSVALSCWFRTVAEARDENRDKRQGCGTACVPPLKSNRNVGKLPGSPARLCARFLARVSWCPGCVGGPGLCLLFRFCVWVWSVVCSSSSGLFLSLFLKEVTTQGTDPRTDL